MPKAAKKKKKKTTSKAPQAKKAAKKAAKKTTKAKAKAKVKVKAAKKPKPKPKPVAKVKPASRKKPAIPKIASPKKIKAPKKNKKSVIEIDEDDEDEDLDELDGPKKTVFKPRFSPEELGAIRVQLIGMLSSHQEEIKQEVFSASERDLAHISDSSDIASDAAEGDLAFRLAESVGVEAAEIERAIEKIDEGSYGYCEVSGRPIPMERLKFLPWATRLVEYQERYELRRKRIEAGELEDLEPGEDLSEIT